MVTNNNAPEIASQRQQIEQARQQVEEAKRQSEAQQKVLEMQKASLPDVTSQTALRQTYSGIAGMQYRSQVAKAQKQIQSNLSNLANYNQQVQGYEQQVAVAEGIQAQNEAEQSAYNRALKIIDKGKAQLYVMYGEDKLVKKYLNQYLKQVKANRISDIANKSKIITPNSEKSVKLENVSSVPAPTSKINVLIGGINSFFTKSVPNVRSYYTNQQTKPLISIPQVLKKIREKTSGLRELDKKITEGVNKYVEKQGVKLGDNIIFKTPESDKVTFVGEKFNLFTAPAYISRRLPIYGTWIQGKETAYRNLVTTSYPTQENITQNLNKEFQNKINQGIYKIDTKGYLDAKGQAEYERRFNEEFSKGQQSFKEKEKQLGFFGSEAPKWVSDASIGTFAFTLFSPAFATASFSEASQILKGKTKGKFSAIENLNKLDKALNEMKSEKIGKKIVARSPTTSERAKIFSDLIKEAKTKSQKEAVIKAFEKFVGKEETQKIIERVTSYIEIVPTQKEAGNILSSGSPLNQLQLNGIASKQKFQSPYNVLSVDVDTTTTATLENVGIGGALFQTPKSEQKQKPKSIFFSPTITKEQTSNKAEQIKLSLLSQTESLGQVPEQSFKQVPIFVQPTPQKSQNQEGQIFRFDNRQENKNKSKEEIFSLFLKKKGLIKRLSKKFEESPESFEVFGKRFGRDIPLGRFSSKKVAEQKLYSFLKTTLGRSGYLKSGGEKVSSDLLKNFQFRKSKVDPFRIVQKSKFSLGTPSERREIQYFKKTKSKKNKNLFF